MLKRLIFWEWPRASWQWDVIVALILAFIFLTPRSWFNDQPRGNPIAMMSAGRFFVDPATLAGLDEAQRLTKVRELIEKRYRERVRITQIEPVVEENELRGYVVHSAK